MKISIAGTLVPNMYTLKKEITFVYAGAFDVLSYAGRRGPK